MRFNAIIDRDCGLRTIKERKKDSKRIARRINAGRAIG